MARQASLALIPHTITPPWESGSQGPVLSVLRLRCRYAQNRRRSEVEGSVRRNAPEVEGA